MNKKNGFLIIETLLSSALLGIIVVVCVGSIIYSQQSAVAAGNMSRAVFLAQAGIEAVRNIRDESFYNLQDGTYGLFISETGNKWILTGNSDVTDGFVRQIEISSIDSNKKLITSTVTWQETPTSPYSREVVFTTELTNWKQ